MPLIVSAYVYDFSGYYSFRWLKARVYNFDGCPEIVNINAGFDETSYILESIYPNSRLRAFDFYDHRRHTEPAIVRARKVSLIYPNTTVISTGHIPLENDSVHLIFLLSAAHEIRSKHERGHFLKECRRVLRNDGRLIIVEHLRDLPNFLAFSIGFTHFFSRSSWFEGLKFAGFETIDEEKFTPFMSIFTCK